MVTTCMFCESSLSFGMKLLHDRYCSAEHKEAYFKSMDRLGLERLIAAKSFDEEDSAVLVKGVGHPDGERDADGEVAEVAGDDVHGVLLSLASCVFDWLWLRVLNVFNIYITLNPGDVKGNIELVQK